MKQFTKKQIRFVAENIIQGQLDLAECYLPTNGIDADDFFGKYDGLCDAMLDSAAMSLSCIYANITGDGMSTDDALIVAGDLWHAWKSWINAAWERGGEDVRERERTYRGGHWQMEDVYKHYPNASKHAKAFADALWAELKIMGKVGKA